MVNCIKSHYINTIKINKFYTTIEELKNNIEDIIDYKEETIQLLTEMTKYYSKIESSKILKISVKTLYNYLNWNRKEYKFFIEKNKSLIEEKINIAKLEIEKNKITSEKKLEDYKEINDIDFIDFLFYKIEEKSKIPEYIKSDITKWIINNNDIIKLLWLNWKHIYQMYRKSWYIIWKTFNWLENGNNILLIKRRNINASHYISIIRGNNWEEKLKLLWNNNFYTNTIKNRKITNRMFCKITSWEEWIEKIWFIQNNWQNLWKLELNWKKLTEIISKQNWKQELNRIFSKNKYKIKFLK